MPKTHFSPIEEQLITELEKQLKNLRYSTLEKHKRTQQFFRLSFKLANISRAMLNDMIDREEHLDAYGDPCEDVMAFSLALGKLEQYIRKEFPNGYE